MKSGIESLSHKVMRGIAPVGFAIASVAGSGCGSAPAESAPTQDAVVETTLAQDDGSAPEFSDPSAARKWIVDRFLQEYSLESYPLNPEWIPSQDNSDFFAKAASYSLIRTLCTAEAEGLIDDLEGSSSTNAVFDGEEIDLYRYESWFPVDAEGDTMVNKEIPEELSEHRDYLSRSVDVYIFRWVDGVGYNTEHFGRFSLWTYYNVSTYFNVGGQMFESQEDMERVVAQYMRVALDAGMNQSLASNPLQSCDQSR